MSETSITKAARGWPVVGNSIARTEFFYSEEGGRFVMAAEVERLESELAAMTAERDAWQAKFVRRLQAVDELTAAKELAERQVAMLCGHIDDYGSCWNCPAKSLGAACSHSGESCRDALAAWSRSEAKKGGEG